MDKNIIRKTKSACVGIGILQKGNPLPLVISGSGFLIDSEGYVLTATHVIDQLVIKKNELRKQGLDVGIVASKVGVHNGHPEIKSRGLIERRRIIIKPSEKFPAPANFDVVFVNEFSAKKTIYNLTLTCKDQSILPFAKRLFECLPQNYKARVSFKQYLQIYPAAKEQPTKLAVVIANLQKDSNVEPGLVSISPQALAIMANLISKQ